MRGETTKVLWVAFDACDAGIAQRLAAEGRCPNLASLLGDGAVIDTVGPYGTFVGSSWMTIATADRVGRHGFHSWLVIDRDAYAQRGTSPLEARGTFFWEQLARAGKRAAVLDVPHSNLPAEPLDLVVLKEWGCHDRHHGTASYPPEVLEELDAQVGRHPYGAMAHPRGDEQFAPCDYTLRAGQHRTLDEERQLREAVLRGITAKRDASLHLLERGDWDLFLTVFGESHCAGHQLWHVHDPDHPLHDPAAAALLGDPVEEAYQWLDGALGDLLARVGPDATVVLQLSHGMGPHYDGHHLLDEVLVRLDGRLERADPGWRTRAARRLLDAAPEPIGRVALRAAAAAVRRRSATAPPQRSHPTGPHPDRRCYQVDGNTSVGAVRFNVAGREPQGIVAPGDVPALCDELAAGLLRLVNVATGRPAVRRVVRGDDVMARTPDDTLPDLFVEWDRSAPIEHVWSPDIGSVAAPYELWRTGDHNDRGLLVIRAPGVAPGRRDGPMDLVDVAPTVCAALGVELSDVEGRPREDLLGGDDSRAGSTIPARPAVQLLPDPALHRRRRRPRATSSHLARRALGLAGAVGSRTDQLERQVASLEAALHATRHELLAQQATAAREQRVWTTMAWLAQEEAPEDELVSVIMPTHARPDSLARAIRSVLAQRYGRWELIVVDDGTRSAAAVVTALGDERIRLLEVPHGGAPAARNAGLAAASGAIVTYLDDDNTFDPGWLHAVVWAFRQHPEHDVLYGARVIDDSQRVLEGGSAGGHMWVQMHPYDRAVLEQGNFADMGVIAHRAGHPAARFDESLLSCADWDLFLALTEDQPPLELPAIAVYYRTDGSDRLTNSHTGYEKLVLDKWAARRAARAGTR